MLLLAAVGVNAQSLKVVVQDNNRQPVALAYINEYDPASHTLRQTQQTGDDGIVNITPQYPCDIEIEALGCDKLKNTLSSAPVTGELKLYLIKHFNTLDQVVVTGVTQPVKMKDALSAYQVIPRAVIQAQGAVTLDDALKNLLNTKISNDEILGSNISLQGMSGDKVKVLMDGMPVNGRESGNVNLGQLNMNNTERIEIIQGPMSVVYGTDALGGVVNIITRTDSKPLALRLNTYYESVGKYNADAALTFKVKKRHQFTIGGGRNYFQGWNYLDTSMKYLSDTLKNVQRYQQFKPKEQYLGNFAYRYTATSGFGLQFFSDYLKETVTNKGMLNVWDPYGCYAFDEYYRTTRSMNRLAMKGKLGKTGKWESQSSYMFYQRDKNRYRKNMVSLQEIPTAGKGDQDTSVFNDVSTRGSYSNKAGKIDYTAGYDVNLEFANSTRIAGTNRSLHDYAVYTTISMPVVKDKLVFQAGARAAYNTNYHPPVIPAFNLLYTPAERLQIRASYAQGFRAPSLKEMYLSFIDANHYVIGNPDLKAERSNHAQLSISYQLYKEDKDYLQVKFTSFYNDVYNGIVLVPLHPEDTASIDYQYYNVKHMRNTIATLEADGEFKHLHFQVGYSSRYTFKEAGSYSAFVAGEASAMLMYAWRAPGLNFSAFYRLFGAQPFLQATIDGSAVYNGHVSAFSLCDASVSKKFLEHKLLVTAGVKNIFNILRPQSSGIVMSSAHGGSGPGSFLPRSVFVSLNLTLD